MTTIAPAGDRRTRIEVVMGLPVSVTVRGPGRHAEATASAVESFFAELRGFDRVFSTYLPRSEVSLIRAGVLAEEFAPPIVREAITLCRRFSRETDGWFEAWLPGPDGRRQFDPSGLVKGWAVEQASSRLAELDGAGWLVNAGGDVTARAADGASWTVGVEDPRDRSRVRLAVPVTDGAVATSGTAARGAHLMDPRTGRPVRTDLLCATVAGPSLTVADVHATALFVQGPAGLARIAALPGYEALLQFRDGSMVATPGLARDVEKRTPDRPQGVLPQDGTATAALNRGSVLGLARPPRSGDPAGDRGASGDGRARPRAGSEKGL